MRYDSRVALISEELQSLQNQVAKFKRERDSTRHMLEAAQKTIGELRNATGGKTTPTHGHINPEDEVILKFYDFLLYNNNSEYHFTMSMYQ